MARLSDDLTFHTLKEDESDGKKSGANWRAILPSSLSNNGLSLIARVSSEVELSTERESRKGSVSPTQFKKVRKIAPHNFQNTMSWRMESSVRKE